MGDEFMICLYVSGVFYRCLWRVYEAYLVGRKHEFVFQESCIDRYQLALDRLIVAKSSSRFPVCNTFPAEMLESDTSVGVEHHEKAEASIIVPGLPYTKLSISLPYQLQIIHHASNLPIPSPPFSSFIFAPPLTFPLALLLHLASFPGLFSPPAFSLLMLVFVLGIALPSAQPFRLSLAHAPQEEM